jgi:hypothetical protein
VHVNAASPYFNQIKDELDLWTTSMPTYDFLKESIYQNNHWNIFSYIKPFKHYQWETFKRIEKFYLDNKHTYTIERNDDTIKYAEFNRDRKVFELEMAEDSLNFKVLYLTNDKIMPLDDIVLIVNNISECRKHTREEILLVIDTLFEKGLLYRSPDYTEIVSVIDLQV